MHAVVCLCLLLCVDGRVWRVGVAKQRAGAMFFEEVRAVADDAHVHVRVTTESRMSVLELLKRFESRMNLNIRIDTSRANRLEL